MAVRRTSTHTFTPLSNFLLLSLDSLSTYHTEMALPFKFGPEGNMSPQADLGNPDDRSFNNNSMRSSSSYDDIPGLQHLKDERDTAMRQPRQLQQELSPFKLTQHPLQICNAKINFSYKTQLWLQMLMSMSFHKIPLIKTVEGQYKNASLGLCISLLK